MKNIIILCDGTGNEISENISNVLKFYRCLRKTDRSEPRQMVFYDPGVGTVTEPSTWHRLKANVNLVLGLATGYGLDDNVWTAEELEKARKAAQTALARHRRNKARYGV